MSLRRTVFLAVFVAVFSTAAIEGVLDVVVDRMVGDGDDRLLFDLLDVPLMLVVALAGAWLIARRIARPLNTLTDATLHVAAQSFPLHVAVPSGDDEIARLTRSFNAMGEAIQSHIDREQAFTRYASHELRTPLSAMRLQIERSELGLVPPSEVLPVLRRQLTQLEEILQALLAFARSPGPDVESRLLAPVLKESLANFPVDARDRFTLTDDSPPQLKVTHSRLLQQALTNLLDNALRHGSGNATVRVMAEERSVTVSVRDRGAGVLPDELGRVTEPFYRGSNSKEPDARPRGPAAATSGASYGTEGVGLGLAFVAFIAKALEGSLTLMNTDVGFEATLTLPIVDTRTGGMAASV